ncbi:MAG TPA: glycosyltransferase [Candidatus Limnocylindrales bacterium]|nr:glycosyltransferase [Candidatus Limnocylindrales bacterium]
MISIIIPSRQLSKESITSIKSVTQTIPFPHEIIISNKAGVALARNWGAKRAKGNVLLFLDDDVILHPELWSKIARLKNNEFMMFLPENARIPCSRLMCISTGVFWELGGFDETFTLTSEDHDFYIRALDAKMKFVPVTSALLTHVDHPSRLRNIHVANAAIRQNMLFLKKHIGRHVDLLETEFFDRAKHGQIRNVVLNLFWLVAAQPRSKSNL